MLRKSAAVAVDAAVAVADAAGCADVVAVAAADVKACVLLHYSARV